MKHALLMVDPDVRINQQIAVGFAKELQKHDAWQIHVVPRDIPYDRVRDMMETVDAVVVRAPHPRLTRHLSQLGKPSVVVATTGLGESESPTVLVDDEAIGGMASEYLLSLGFDHYGVLEYAPEGPVVRTEVFKLAVQKSGKGLHGHPMSVPVGVDRPFGGYEQSSELVEWLRELPKPCAVFAYSDQPGASLIDTCLEQNIRVPEEISVVGVDDDPLFCHTVMPNLASIHIPYGNIGVEAARLLLAGAPAGITVKVGPAMVVERASCRLPHRRDGLVEMALDYLCDNVSQGVKVRELQALTGLTSHQLVYRFKMVTGRTPIEMILRHRIACAKELLAETSEPVAKIAHECGFNNANRFYVNFRDQVGMSPKEYRAQFTV